MVEKRIYFLSRSVEESMEGVKKFKGVNWHTTAFTCRADGREVRRCFPDGRQLGFNSVHEGSRQVYVMDVR